MALSGSASGSALDWISVVAAELVHDADLMAVYGSSGLSRAGSQRPDGRSSCFPHLALSARRDSLSDLYACRALRLANYRASPQLVQLTPLIRSGTCFSNHPIMGKGPVAVHDFLFFVFGCVDVYSQRPFSAVPSPP